MRNALLLGILTALTTGVLAQAPPAFEVASIKPNRSGDARVRFALPPGRFTATNAPLRDIIRVAHQIADFQLVNLPAWAATERFDIEATTRAPEATGKGPMRLGLGGPPPELFLMLRSLLAERVKLTAHTEIRQMPIYALVLVRKDKTLGQEMSRSTIACEALSAAALASPGAPPKTPRPGQPPKCGMFGVAGRLEGWSATMPELAQMLTQLMDRIVVDRTALVGGFDFRVVFTPPQMRQDDPATAVQPPVDPSGPSLTTALQEQLGLELEPTRGPVDVLVIDSVSRPTAD